MRSPLTATIFGVELTGDVHALFPLIVACAAAHGLTVLVLKRSILTERIARRGHHLTRDYSVDPFELIRVKEVMATQVDTLQSSMKVADAIEFFTTEVPRHKSYPLIDDHGHLVGMVSRTDALGWIRACQDRTAALGELVNADSLLTASPDELAGQLADRMMDADVGRVPVVDARTSGLIGLVSRKDLLRVRAHMLAQEHTRSAPLRGLVGMSAE